MSVSKKSNKKLYPYGSKQPLEVLGIFSALTKVRETEVEAEFVVIDGEGEALRTRQRNRCTVGRVTTWCPSLLSED